MHEVKELCTKINTYWKYDFAFEQIVACEICRHFGALLGRGLISFCLYRFSRHFGLIYDHLPYVLNNFMRVFVTRGFLENVYDHLLSLFLQKLDI